MAAPMYERGLDRNDANYMLLTPLLSLDRCAELFPERIAIVHGAMRQTWATTHSRRLRRARPSRYQAGRHRVYHCTQYAPDGRGTS